MAAFGACAVLLVAAPAALALSGNSASGNAAAAQYSPTANNQASRSNGSTPTTTPQTSTASLPFTGYALLTALGIGVCLLSVGAVLRRRSGDTRA